MDDCNGYFPLTLLILFHSLPIDVLLLIDEMYGCQDNRFAWRFTRLALALALLYVILSAISFVLWYRLSALFLSLLASVHYSVHHDTGRCCRPPLLCGILARAASCILFVILFTISSTVVPSPSSSI